MAVGDVYAAHWRINSRTQATSLNLHYQELNPSDSGLNETESLAEALMNSLITSRLQSALSDDGVYVGGVNVYKKSGNVVAPAFATDHRPGTAVGAAAPMNNALRILLGQAVFPSNRNGLVWLAGMREDDMAGNQFTQAYISGPATDLANELVNVLLETPNDGQWRLGVLSRKHLIDNPGDYAGAFADVLSASASPIVGSQRRRTTRLRGAPGNI